MTVHNDTISHYNEHLKIVQRRMEYLRRQPKDNGFAKAELQALLWMTEEVLPAWVREKVKEHANTTERRPDTRTNHADTARPPQRTDTERLGV